MPGNRIPKAAANAFAAARGEDAHAIAAVEWLNQQVLGHKFSGFVVFAAPRTLGEIRKHYHKLTEQALLDEINKSMSGRQPRELIAALHEPA